mmetsp:Transcript_2867/g.4849  ORF Transcript_2867/g.4849 Transcript_2867/m.4849 type:complete len:93 (-) Transcript_2867:119-397(-)
MHPATIACFVDRAIDFGELDFDSSSAESSVFSGTSCNTSGTGKATSSSGASPPRRAKAAERAKTGGVNLRTLLTTTHDGPLLDDEDTGGLAA